ncbi:MAG: flagellar basal-body MS-ring/collar protein FliF [Candidatus Velthaea sp.]
MHRPRSASQRGPFLWDPHRWHLDRLTASFAQLTQQVRDIWSAQNRTNRLLIGGFALLLVLAGGFFTATRLRGPDYAVLFSNLSPDDASSVVSKLKDDKTPYRLSDGGATILVQQEQVYEERVALAGDGVVKGGGSGWELFDKTNLGMTDFQEKIDKQRATEGELQRTIAGLTPVASARVHIATPESTLYSTTQQPTTASVAIKTKPGMELSSSEVRGITQLISGAVDGLKPENVTIVNQDGNVLIPSTTEGNGLTAEGGSAASALKLTQDQLIAKQHYEANLQENIQGMLDAALGPHRSAVRVATDMNFDATQSDTKTYSPQGTIRSQQTEKESYAGQQPQRGAAVGIPGTTTNTVPTYQGQQQQQTTAGRYSKSKNTVNYEITEQVSKHIDAPGKVTRTSVAVLVNVPPVATVPGANGTAVAATTYAVNPSDVAKIRNVVAAAAGIDPARGDQLSVEAIPFAPLAETGRTTVATVLGIPVAALIAVLGILALGGIGYLALMRRRSGSGGAFSPSMELPSFDSSLAEELPSFEEHPMLEGSGGIAAPIRSAADLTREQMIEYVTTVAQENPDNIAKLVKLWLAE